MNELEMRRMTINEELVKIDERLDSMIQRLEQLQSIINKNNGRLEKSNQAFKERMEKNAKKD